MVSSRVGSSVVRKNLTDLSAKEIDAYIDFARDFLLNDQPEPTGTPLPFPKTLNKGNGLHIKYI
jgi:hypothetical protein